MAQWDTGTSASFEELPQNSENVSLGAQRIRNLKNEIRLRADVESDWGTATGGNTDTGRLRGGSARLFVGTGDPAVLTKADYLGSAALDSGRGIFNTNTKTLRVHNGAAFETVAGPAPEVRDQQSHLVATAYPAATTTNWGGTDLALIVPQFGTYLTTVMGYMSVSRGAAFAANPLSWNLLLQEDPGTAVFGTVAFSTIVLPRAPSDGATMFLAVHWMPPAAVTPNVTYRYRLQCQNSSAGGLDFVNVVSLLSGKLTRTT